MARRRLELEIVGDERNLNRALGRTETRLKKFDRSVGNLKGLSPRTAGAAGFAGGIITSEAVRQISKAVGVASNLNEQVSKSRVVFGQSSNVIEEWAKTTASSIFIARDQAIEAASTFGTMFDQAGESSQDAARLSKAVVTLAADLASFNNTSTDDALLALRSGLSGEIEPLRRFQVFLTEATVAQRAMEQSGKDNARELTQGEKIMARYSLILEQTAKQQGDAARTAGGLANQQRKLAAQTRDLQANLGQLLLPVMTQIVSALNQGTSAALKFGDALERIGSINIPTIEIPFTTVEIPGTGSTVGGAVKGVAKDIAGQTAASAVPGGAVARRGKQLFDAIFGSTPGPDVTGAAKAFEDQFGFKLPNRPKGGGGARPPAFGQPGFTPLKPSPISLQTTTRLDEQLLDARLSGSDAAIKKALANSAAFVRDALQDPRLTGKQRSALKQALLGFTDEIAAIDDAAANAARDATDKAKSAKQEAARKQKDATEKALRAQKKFMASLVEGAEKLRDAALAALDRTREKRNFARDLEEANKQLALAQKIGSPTAVRDAKRAVEDVKLEHTSFLLESATFSPTKVAGPGGTRATATSGVTVTIGNISLPGVTNATQLLRELQRIENTQATTRRGRYGGRGGI